VRSFRLFRTRVVAIPYGRFGTNYWSPLTLEDGTDRLSRNVSKELTTNRCVITQKSAVHRYLISWALQEVLL
jgi:hypothetical protein